MSDDRSSSGSLTARWLERLVPGVVGEPRDRKDLIALLKQAKDRALFDTEALAMLEGVLQVADLQVRDIMIPRAQMVVVGRDNELFRILARRQVVKVLVGRRVIDLHQAVHLTRLYGERRAFVEHVRDILIVRLPTAPHAVEDQRFVLVLLVRRVLRRVARAAPGVQAIRSRR